MSESIRHNPNLQIDREPLLDSREIYAAIGGEFSTFTLSEITAASEAYKNAGKQRLFIPNILAAAREHGRVATHVNSFLPTQPKGMLIAEFCIGTQHTGERTTAASIGSLDILNVVPDWTGNPNHTGEPRSLTIAGSYNSPEDNTLRIENLVLTANGYIQREKDISRGEAKDYGFIAAIYHDPLDYSAPQQK
jgi:hypothetical protein